jgi:hypothetical protein
MSKFLIAVTMFPLPYLLIFEFGVLLLTLDCATYAPEVEASRGVVLIWNSLSYVEELAA